jgi:hypothetical protein
MIIRNECSFLKPESISKIEEHYKATYVFESCLKGRDGNWLNFPAAIFYTETPHPEGSNYFAFYDFGDGARIANGISATEVEYTGIVVGEEVAYSRYRHDYRTLDECFVDGGRDYLRTGGNPDSLVKFKVVKDKLEIVELGLT